MIREYNKNIAKCHNCSTLWTFSDDDVEENILHDGFFGDYKEHYIKCPKCNTYLELYNDKGRWK